MSEQVGAEQTPDIEALVTNLADLFEARRDMLRNRLKPSTMDRREANTWDVAAYDLRALAPVLTAAVREARAAELREAAEDWTDTDDPGAIYADNGDVDLWLRDRADRIAVDAPEGGA